MREKQTESSTVLWLMPTTILLIAIVIMFIDFYTTSSQSAQTQVEKNFTSVAEGYASKLEERLIAIQKSGKTIAEIMENHSKKELGLAEETVEALYSQSDAYMVIMANLAGRGVDQTKQWISVEATDYYEQIKDGTEKFLYLKDDGITGKRAVLGVLPIYTSKEENAEIGGMLLLYYPINEFDSLIKPGEFDGNAFYLLADSEGQILESVEGEWTVLNSEKVWDMVTDEVTKGKVRIKMQQGNSGIVNAKDGEIEYRLFYVPVDINDWYMIVGVKQDYAQHLQNETWNNTRMMFIELIVIIGVFFGIIITLNVVSKIRSNEKAKDLADKADTDLLTDLNNKLATERKIKEYIAQHPNEQALLFVLDVDNFKKINDTMGHAFGDEVLSAIGHGIKGEFRVSDIVGRTGGDEFMILLKNVHSDALIDQEAQRLTRFFKELRVGEYVKYSPTASIGAAVFPNDAKDFEGLYKAADKALYKAKERGKNQLAFYIDRN